MSTWLRPETPLSPAHGDVDERRDDLFRRLRDKDRDRARAGCPQHTAQITADGADWLVSASAYPSSTLALWEARPTAPAVLPCGTVFDVVNVPAIFGRRLLDRLWEEGPGSGPVATHRGRMLLFTAPGTGRRLPSLLAWEEWGGAVPPMLCHSVGDAVTLPPLAPGSADGPRWVVAPDTRSPWLPGPEVLLWACVRVARATSAGDVRVSISPDPDTGANVYDVSRRR
ncbi:bifunctional DNA primase/polymerase [Streptomyces sp. TRM64462]|uniref:bifunctional DNA primase/polymerase n=1 Tax=Streptomyces sp. TRM64462 TaxID=2741726 RepID=UPI0015862011|nr:bifunctional DNA primase/polymerase [Streptomyces sp. TRM64462]